MVLIHISRGTEEFILETRTTDSVNTTTRLIANIHNRRLQIKRLCGGVRELAKYGPMKEDQDRGLSEEQINALGDEKKEIDGADPLGIRIGQAPHPDLQRTLSKAADDAEAAVSNTLAKQRKPLELSAIDTAFDNIRGAVTMAYPGQLPEWDQVRQCIEGTEDLTSHADGKQVLDEATAILWFAGKAMDRSLLLSKYIGTNEKVTIKAKIEPPSAGAPSREPAVDAETQKRMMALWHRKEAENQALREESEDAYMNSEWANPNQFKQRMNGIGDIHFRAGGSRW